MHNLEDISLCSFIWKKDYNGQFMSSKFESITQRYGKMLQILPMMVAPLPNKYAIFFIINIIIYVVILLLQNFMYTFRFHLNTLSSYLLRLDYVF